MKNRVLLHLAIAFFISSHNVLHASHVKFHAETDTQAETATMAAQATPLELVMIARAAAGTLTEEELLICINSGVNINAQDQDGMTALMKTIDTDQVNEKRAQIVELLLKNNAQMNILSKKIRQH